MGVHNLHETCGYGAYCAKAELQSEVIPFKHSMGHQSGAKQALLVWIASSDTTLWPIQWQKSAIFTLFIYPRH